MAAIELTVSAAKPCAEVTLRSQEEVDDLISSTKEAAKQSKRSGGRYLANVKDTTGEVTIFVWLVAK